MTPWFACHPCIKVRIEKDAHISLNHVYKHHFFLAFTTSSALDIEIDIMEFKFLHGIEKKKYQICAPYESRTRYHATTEQRPRPLSHSVLLNNLGSFIKNIIR